MTADTNDLCQRMDFTISSLRCLCVLCVANQ